MVTLTNIKEDIKLKEGGKKDLDLKKVLLNVLKSISAHRDADVFQFPVSLEEAPDYDQVIKYRIDLSTLKKKVLDGVDL